MNKSLVYIFAGGALANAAFFAGHGDWYTALWAAVAAIYAYRYGRELPND